MRHALPLRTLKDVGQKSTETNYLTKFAVVILSHGIFETMKGFCKILTVGGKKFRASCGAVCSVMAIKPVIAGSHPANTITLLASRSSPP